MNTLLENISDENVRIKVKEFLEWNQEPSMVNEIKNLIENNQFQVLKKLFLTRLEFGTSGLRARMGCGFSQLNQLTIIQTTQGVYQYFKRVEPKLKDLGVVIGRDHRHNSNEYARLTASVFLRNGVKVYYYKSMVHTPMVPFGVKMLGAACGIMITASHNPKDDNGYKLYGENGCQIIPPLDVDISKEIDCNLKPLVWDMDLVETRGDLVVDPTFLIEDYFKKLRENMLPVAKEKLKICYTAMHGVGFPFAMRVAEILEQNFVMVKDQCNPNPDFPTVKFPNPEEKGALDMAIQVARVENCSLIFANDPDVDRLAVAEVTPNNEWLFYVK